jgi:hypothetical protein
MDSKELIGYLNDAAEACFKEQISGWGNLMGTAADHIAALESDNARLRAALAAMVTATSNFNVGLAEARELADAALTPGGDKGER